MTEEQKNDYHENSTSSDRQVTFTLFNSKDELNEKTSRIQDYVARVRDYLEVRLKSIRTLLSDWLFLAILGIVVALISISVDVIIYHLQNVQEFIFEFDPKDSFVMWLVSLIFLLTYTVGLIATSATFVHYVSPQAIGSGIPEMKTIIRGVILKDYLTFRTMVSKIVGVAMSLASGLPTGKMGPFVHIASAVANQLCKLASKIDPAYKEESKRMECLVAACAVGVACTFSSPVGGVLFSIEVTTMYFSVRSYWRGFFAACCGATTIRLLKGWFQTEVTVNAFFQTSFPHDAFRVNELPLFGVLGLLCGFMGAFYISVYKNIVLFLRKNKFAMKIFQRHWIVYPIVISTVYCLVSHPFGLGKFFTGRMRFGKNLQDFFRNCSFTASRTEVDVCASEVYHYWSARGYMPVLLLLITFFFIHFIFSIMSMTLPIPSGVFLPIFVLGAAFGRLFGEIMDDMFENSLLIQPGIYAVVGAAAFSASVTHSVSVSVMIFELTGQLHFILPVMIAVLLANAVGAYLHPSFFDTIIKIKHLPFLPNIPPSSHMVHTTFAENIMVSPVNYVTKIGTYRDILEAVENDYRIFPVVDSKETQLLIGTVSRRYLVHLLNKKLGGAARRQEAERRVKSAIQTIDSHFKDSQKEIGENKRTLSESTLEHLRNKSSTTSLELPSKTKQAVTRGRKTSRFLVIPIAQHEKIIQPQSKPERKNSFTRRNAFCSLAEKEPSRARSIDEKSDGGSSAKENSTIHRTIHSITNEYHTFMKSYIKQAKKYIHYMQFGHGKPKGAQPVLYDLVGDERTEWERKMLDDILELTDSDIDASPFQLVKKTSLFKIHSIFSMLQLSKAYVTDFGRLIGVVALSDVRKAIEKSEETKEKTKKHKKAEAMVLPIFSKDSVAHVVDILTPTLEIIRGTTFENTPNVTIEEDVSIPKEVDMLPEHNEETIFLREPSLKSCLKGSEAEKPTRVSLDETDELVEAVSYLKRKSRAMSILDPHRK